MNYSINKLIFITTFIYMPLANAAFDGNYVFQLEAATQTELNNIGTPQTGMMVYNTTQSKIYYYDGATWTVASSSSIFSEDGQLNGNRQVDLNTFDLGFINGNIGINNTLPSATLDINGSLQLSGILYDKDGDAGTTGQVLTSTSLGTDWVTTISAPYISSDVTNMLISSTITFTIRGKNFIPTSTVTIPGFDGTIDNVNVISPTEIEITLTSGTTETDYDIIVSNNGILNTQWSGNGTNLLHVAASIQYLFAITDSSNCAETLAYGPDHITEASTAYFSTEYKDISHNKMLQIFTVNGSEIYRINYNFTTTKTLQNRFSDAVNLGETVNWVVTQGANTFNYGPYLWWYSDGANITAGSAKWTGSGNNWSGDDGSWGAAPNNVDGNGGPYETWGHGNHNSADAFQCDNYYTNGTQATSSTIKSYMYMVVP